MSNGSAYKQTSHIHLFAVPKHSFTFNKCNCMLEWSVCSSGRLS